MVNLLAVHPYRDFFLLEDEARAYGLLFEQGSAVGYNLFQIGIQVARLRGGFLSVLRLHVHLLEVQQFGGELIEVSGAAEGKREQVTVGFGQRVLAVKVA